MRARRIGSFGVQIFGLKGVAMSCEPCGTESQAARFKRAHTHCWNVLVLTRALCSSAFGDGPVSEPAVATLPPSPVMSRDSLRASAWAPTAPGTAGSGSWLTGWRSNTAVNKASLPGDARAGGLRASASTTCERLCARPLRGVTDRRPPGMPDSCRCCRNSFHAGGSLRLDSGGWRRL